ncbi:MAG: DUF1307 domain-containing protein [Longicatena sp.]
MKKLLCMAFAVICLSACGGEKETKTMVCSLEQETSGIKTEMNMDIGYEGDKVVTQNQEAIITADSKEVYDAMIPTLKAYSKEDEYKGMDGVTYTIKEDEENLRMVEKVTLDFYKISADDYKTVSGDSSIDLEKDKIDVDKTKERLEGQGFSCVK